MRGRGWRGQKRGYWSTVDEARGRGVRGRRRERARARCYPALPDVLHTTWPHLTHSRQLSRNIQAQHTQRGQDDRCASITPDLTVRVRYLPTHPCLDHPGPHSDPASAPSAFRASSDHFPNRRLQRAGDVISSPTSAHQRTHSNNVMIVHFRLSDSGNTSDRGP